MIACAVATAVAEKLPWAMAGLRDAPGPPGPPGQDGLDGAGRATLAIKADDIDYFDPDLDDPKEGPMVNKEQLTYLLLRRICVDWSS